MQSPAHDLVLHAYWRSSASYRVRLALAAKGLAYRIVTVNILAGEQVAEPHLARSPTGYVPALVIDGVAYHESVAILELLEDLYPEPPLYPRDPFAKARVRALVEMVNAGIQPLQNLSVTRHVSADPAARDAWVDHFATRGLAALERAVAAGEASGVAGPFLHGDRVTAADLCLVPQLMAARRFKVDVAPYARLLRAEAATLALPGLDAAAPERQPDAVAPG
jgi:maleylacetoacetate isomerase